MARILWQHWAISFSYKCIQILIHVHCASMSQARKIRLFVKMPSDFITSLLGFLIKSLDILQKAWFCIMPTTYIQKWNKQSEVITDVRSSKSAADLVLSAIRGILPNVAVSSLAENHQCVRHWLSWLGVRTKEHNIVVKMLTAQGSVRSICF